MKVRPSEHQGESPRTGKHLKGTLSTSVRDYVLDCNHLVAQDDFEVLGSLIIGFWRSRRVYLLKEIDLRLIRIFTRRSCHYFSFTISVIKFWQLLFVAIGYAVYKSSRLINSCKQFNISVGVYLIMEAVTSESS